MSDEVIVEGSTAEPETDVAETMECPTCGAELAYETTPYGSRVAEVCTTCYGEADTVEEKSDAPASQTAAAEDVPRELGTDVTQQDS